ncbi:hypothetical protein [Bradyrhizobium sp. B117]|uniref:hypothetical protein n=1 Tax=Bradyrhizobium sp. B117 TaxID=3140246 RepID=UPI003183E4D8
MTEVSSTPGALAIRRMHKLARNLVYQFVMLPARAIAFGDVPGAIISMGLGAIVTDADDHIRMKWTNSGSSRRQQGVAHS